MNTLKSSVLTSYDPCKDNRCRKGECVSKKDGKNYSCKCQAGWGGKYCDSGTIINNNQSQMKEEPFKLYTVFLLMQRQRAGRSNIVTTTWSTAADPPNQCATRSAAAIAAQTAAVPAAPRSAVLSSSAMTEPATPRRLKSSVNAAALESVPSEQHKHKTWIVRNIFFKEQQEMKKW